MDGLPKTVAKSLLQINSTSAKSFCVCSLRGGVYDLSSSLLPTELASVPSSFLSLPATTPEWRFSLPGDKKPLQLHYCKMLPMTATIQSCNRLVGPPAPKPFELLQAERYKKQHGSRILLGLYTNTKARQVNPT
jgi:hypothetical protein